jgi:hypothetical protein
MDLMKKKFNVHFIFVDNTISSIKHIPQEIKDILEINSAEIYLIDKNQYGKRNKGAGDIEVWKEYINKILGYRWFLHFEPRTFLKESNFICSFCESPRDLFKILNEDVQNPHFYTGIFYIEPEKLNSFIDSVDLDQMVNQSISIEYSLKDFMDKKFPNYSSYDQKLNIIWHDSAQDRLIEF